MINYQRLKEIREDHDINQETMAKIIGVKRSTYAMWEIGINIIPILSLCAFADYFDLSIDYVLGLTNDKNKNQNRKGLDLKVLGLNMKKARLKANLTQIEMAKMLDVKQASIARYENGIFYISTSNLYKFSKLTKVPIHTLCGKNNIK